MINESYSFYRINELSILLIMLLLLIKSNKENKVINIFIGNSFRHYYSLPANAITCSFNRRIYRCQYSNNKSVKYSASIYNGNKKFPEKPKSSYGIIITTEKLSQVMFMNDIGEGKSKYYKLAVDYRLFNNKWHLSIPRYLNLSKFIYSSQINFKNIMKLYNVESFGNDMNNRMWPRNVSKMDKIEILKRYKFCLAIENSVITWKIGDKFEASTINNDYITAKLTDCLIAGSIPIYFGPHNINNFLPDNNSIINMSNFSNINKLVDYLKKIKNNISLLQNHHNWRYNYSKKWFNKFNIVFNYCNICNHVLQYA